jgi:hypothetical protein
MNLFKILLLSLICASAHAQWTDKAGNRIPDSNAQKSNGNFIAQLIFVTDEQKFFEKWAAPSESVYIDPLDEVTINHPISSFIIFGGCQPDSEGNCNVTMQFTVTQPDRKIYTKTPLMEVWQGKPAPPGRSLEASVQYLKIIVEPDEQRGAYLVMVTVIDQNAGASIKLEKQFSAIDGADET